MKVAIRRFAEGTETEIRDFSDIAFGEGEDRICVSVRRGKINISCLHGSLVILPSTSNVVEVETRRF